MTRHARRTHLRPDAGVSPVALMVVWALGVIALGAAFTFAAQQARLTHAIEQAETEREARKAEAADLAERVFWTDRWSGFYTQSLDNVKGDDVGDTIRGRWGRVGSKQSFHTSPAGIKKHVAELQDRLVMLVNEGNRMAEDLDLAEQKVLELEENELTVAGQLDVLNRYLRRLDTFLMRFESARALAESRKADAEESVRTIRQVKEDEIDRWTAVRDDLQSTLDSLEDAYDAESSAFESALEDLRSKVDAAQRDWSRTRSQLQTALDNLVSEIERETRREARATSEREDGEVVGVDTAGKWVFLDLDERDGVTRGMIFRVYGWASGGRRVLKGMVEVKKIQDGMSQAELLTPVNDADPIVKGDKVSNVLFDPDRSLVVSLLGEFREGSDQDGYRMPGREWLVAKMEALGATVLVDDVTLETDFIVVGSEVDEENETLILARNLGMEELRLSQIMPVLPR